MALTFPYALDFLAKCLIGPSIPLNLQRFDEQSGSGDGRFWAAQMAGPLWGATYSLYSKHGAHAREINAKVYALDGMSKVMFWADPYYKGPAEGVVAGNLTGVTVSGIRAADRGAVALTGLPQGQRIEAGDYLSITYTGGRVYFGTFAEAGTANAAGNIAQREIRPYLPMGIGVGASVELVRPYFRAMVTDYTPFANYRGQWGENASITILQKP